MKHIGEIIRDDWRRLTASVVVVVVLLGLCLVPCLYAWFNILSNWDPYGPSSTGNIKVAVASQDEGYEMLGMELNIGELVLNGLQTNDQMGWVFVDDAHDALEGVYSGAYYAALIIPANFTGDFVSVLEGDLRHPEIEYYENEKKNAIAPKITSKAKTAVQAQINTTIVEKVAEAITTSDRLFSAMGMDPQAVANELTEKIGDAQNQAQQLSEVLASLQKVIDDADSLLDVANLTAADVNQILGESSALVGEIGNFADSTSDKAQTANADVLDILNHADTALSDLETTLASWSTLEPTNQQTQDVLARVDKLIQTLQTVREKLPEEVRPYLDSAIQDLQDLRKKLPAITDYNVMDSLVQLVASVRTSLRTAALKTNPQVSEYLAQTNEKTQATLRSVQELLGITSGSMTKLPDTLDGYAGALGQAQTTLQTGITLANTIAGDLGRLKTTVENVTGSEAFREFSELLENDPGSLPDYLSSPVQMNTEVVYEIQDYGSAMAPYYIMLALFVGSLLSVVLLRVPVSQPEFAGYRAMERYFARFATFLLIALAQALVTSFGCLYFVGMQSVSPWRFVLACCLCSLNFSAMNYALVYALDNIGKCAAVIIMVIQVAGSGGSYPVHVLPEIFQKLYPVMPFHYGMDMIRETIGGMYGDTYLRCGVILVLMSVGFTVFGLLMYYPARKLNAIVAASMERSGIM